jgi:hypothetical protein
MHPQQDISCSSSAAGYHLVVRATTESVNKKAMLPYQLYFGLSLFRVSTTDWVFYSQNSAKMARDLARYHARTEQVRKSVQMDLTVPRDQEIVQLGQ